MQKNNNQNTGFLKLQYCVTRPLDMTVHDCADLAFGGQYAHFLCFIQRFPVPVLSFLSFGCFLCPIIQPSHRLLQMGICREMQW